MWWLSLAGCAAGPTPGDTSDSAPQTEDTVDTATVPDELVLVSLNLHCFKLEGTAYPSNDERLAAIAAYVRSQGVEAIAVQEACRRDNDGGALIEQLAAALGDGWGQAWVETHTAWAGEPDEAIEGIGLLYARGAPEEVESLEYAVQGALVRKTLAGTIRTTAGTPLRLYTVHLDWDPATDVPRRAQARQTAMHALVTSTAPVLIAGDYNAESSTTTITDLLAAGFTRLTEAADADGTDIDHVLAPTAAGFAVVEARRIFDGTDGPVVSDHHGILVRLRVGTPQAAVTTRLAATCNTGVGHFLAVRGDTDPLSWELGWPAVNTAADRWEVAFAGWSSGTVAYKWLTDDLTWETGDNHAVDAGATAEDGPGF